jgi:phospholipid transport system transporter-binding protein
VSEAALKATDRAGHFRLCGDVGFASARTLWEEGRREFAAVESIVVDLSAVDRVDSAGVALLVSWVRDTRGRGAAIRFVNMPAQILDIARVCGVDVILPFDSDSAHDGSR